MPINTEDLTQIELDGDGVFDRLMAAGRKQINEEFCQGRIRGNDYATVLTGLIGAAMQASISYTLEKPLADQRLINLQAELPNIELQDDLTQATIDRTEAETINVQATLPTIQLGDEKIQAEIDFLNSQREGQDKQNDLTDEEINLIIQRTATERANTNPVGTVAGSLVAVQTQKIQGETELLAKKTQTECMQTEDGASANSVIGRQIRLYAEQASGYSTDRKVKVAKLYADSVNVQTNINENIEPGLFGFTTAATSAALAAARASA